MGRSPASRLAPRPGRSRGRLRERRGALPRRWGLSRKRRSRGHACAVAHSHGRAGWRRRDGADVRPRRIPDQAAGWVRVGEPDVDRAAAALAQGGRCIDSLTWVLEYWKRTSRNPTGGSTKERQALRAKLLIALTTFATLVVVALIVVPNRANGEVSRHATVEKDDVSAFSNEVTIDHPVGGGVVVMNGSATIDQPVSGDVVVLGGSVTLRGNAHIFGDLACFGGKVVGAENRVDGDVFAAGSLNHALESLS